MDCSGDLGSQSELFRYTFGSQVYPGAPSEQSMSSIYSSSKLVFDTSPDPDHLRLSLKEEFGCSPTAPLRVQKVSVSSRSGLWRVHGVARKRRVQE